APLNISPPQLDFLRAATPRVRPPFPTRRSSDLCLPPARMHFCVSATRGGLQCGFTWPRKIGTNWFMPALVNNRFGASGNSDDDGDRKSTRLNSSHVSISYAVFCLKKKKAKQTVA